MAMTKYVCGFLFSGERVLFVRKTHPEWQKGLLNGIGGKVDDRETPVEAMRREFLEETKHDVPDWDLFAIEAGSDYMVYFFRARLGYPKDPMPVRNDVGEILEWWHTDMQPFRRAIIGNLQWLIPMAQDWRKMVATVNVTDNITVRPWW